MSTLARYVSGLILVRLLVVLFAFAAFEISFDLLEEADKILAAHGGAYGAIARYAALRLPGLLSDLLPVATLLAALLALGELMRHRELVASWNLGLSPGRLALKLLPLALLLGLAQATLGEALVPPAAKGLAAMGYAERGEGLLAAPDNAPLWVRQGPDVVRIIPAGAEEDARSVAIFRLDPEGVLVERIDARSFVPTADGWMLQDVVRRPVGARQTERVDRLGYADTLDLSYLDLLATDARDLPFEALVRILRMGETGSRPYSLFLTWAIYRAVRVAVPGLMIVLAVALAQRYDRTAGLARLLVTGIGLGFLYAGLDRAALALGEVGMMPAWLAATGPTLAVAGAVGWLLWRGRRRARARSTVLAT